MRVDIYEFLSSHNNQIEDQFEQYSVLEERKDRRIYKEEKQVRHAPFIRPSIWKAGGKRKTESIYVYNTHI